LITYIVPTFNGQKTLESSIKSVLAQIVDFKISLFIVENGKTNKAIKEICNKYPNVNYVYCSSKGRSFARNFLIDQITTPFIAYLDDDVELDPLWSQMALRSFTSPLIAATGGRVERVGSDGIILDLRQSLSSLATGTSSNTLDPINSVPSINTASVLMRTNVLKELGGFDPTFKRVEDTELSYRILTSGYALCANNEMYSRVYYQKSLLAYFISRPLRTGFYLELLRKRYFKSQKKIFKMDWEPFRLSSILKAWMFGLTVMGIYLGRFIEPSPVKFSNIGIRKRRINLTLNNKQINLMLSPVFVVGILSTRVHLYYNAFSSELRLEGQYAEVFKKVLNDPPALSLNAEVVILEEMIKSKIFISKLI
jgi:glycosyltransferase involved in cell wall biosynthesis